MKYFNYASLGIPEQNAIKDAQKFLEELTMDIAESEDDYTLKLISIVNETRQKIANIYQVPVKNIAFITNTTEGLGIVASALNNSQLETKVVVPDIDFISSAQVWHGNSNTLTIGQTYRGILSPKHIHQYLEHNHNILCMSSVQEVSGYRFSFQELLEYRKKRDNEFWIVDGIQESGIIWRDLKNDQIDAYVVGGHKWLNSPFGLGFMYISNRLLNTIKPPYYGYFNLQEPDGGWIKYLESRLRRLTDLDEMPFLKEASIFEPGGMVNAFGALMLRKGLEQWENFGIEKAKKKIIELQKVFRTLLEKSNGIEILGDSSEKTWSSIVTVTTSDEKRDKELNHRISRHGIKASYRATEGIGGIRFGFHYNNTRKEIEFLARLLNNLNSTL